MASSNNKSGNKRAVFWILKRTKRYIPVVILIAFFSVIVSLAAIVLALLSKDVLDVATGNKEGSFFYYGALILAVIAVEILLHIVDVILKAYANGKIVIAIRNKLFTAISRRKYSEITDIIEETMNRTGFIESPTLDEILVTEQEVYEFINSKW